MSTIDSLLCCIQWETIHALIRQQWCFNEQQLLFIVNFFNYMPEMKFRLVNVVNLVDIVNVNIYC